MDTDNLRRKKRGTIMPQVMSVMHDKDEKDLKSFFIEVKYKVKTFDGWINEI